MTWRLIKKWEEKKIFEFKKSDIHNPAFGIGSTDYDPYPNHKPGDIVERRVIGNEFFVEGEHISDDPLQMGVSYVIDNLKYTIVSMHQNLGIQTSEIKTAFVASHIEEYVRPLHLLESIRKEKLTGQGGPE
jgi:hypothetical protein